MRDYISEKLIIYSEGKPMKLIVLKPTKAKLPADKTPGILWIHGGGYATGMAAMVYMSRAIDLVKKYGAVVISPEYRLSGKAAYPAALEDCYAALLYLRNNCADLGCSSERLMVGGESAGGGLTAALCIHARDKGEVNIAFQMPLYPMIDDRDTPSSADNHGISWNTRRNHAAWKLYLRDLEGKHVPPTAAPARCEDFSGLPPAYTFVGDREAFYCETLDYVERLKTAGISAKADVYPTGFHAFDMLLPFRKISRQAIECFEKEYLFAAENYVCPQNGKKGE